MGLKEVRIVLVEPAGPLNVGAIARIMRNMGLSQLVLVNPQCDPLAGEARKMAMHGVELLESALQVPDLPTALRGCRRAIATTVRDRRLDTTLEDPSIVLPWLLESDFPSALIFGPEDRGLSNEELNHAQRFLRIPSNPEYPSLNLAQAVAICCYELYQHTQRWSDPESIAETPQIFTASEVPLLFQDQTEPSTHSHPSTLINPDPEISAPIEALEGYYQHLEALLLKIQYLYPHTAESRMKKFRRLFNRAALSENEVAMLRGILSHIEWAIDPDNKK